jgi:pimeloyl-ACP methyl ester carboxylesterase
LTANLGASTVVGNIALAHGNLVYAQAGEGPAVLLLHQTPRSWDEYRDVLPLLAAAGLRAIAFDTPGFGASAPLPGEPTIERWARTVLDGLDALEIARMSGVGHHTGGCIAIEVAAQQPGRVSALVLSSTPLTDAAYRAQPPDESGVDAAEDAEGLRRSRAGFYPAERPDLLDRYVSDALKAGPLAQMGHRAVGSYEMDRALAGLEMPTLLIGATEDPFAHPQLAALQGALPHAEVTEIVGGMVPLPDGWPEAFAEAVVDFLGRVMPGGRG